MAKIFKCFKVASVQIEYLSSFLVVKFYNGVMPHLIWSVIRNNYSYFYNSSAAAATGSVSQLDFSRILFFVCVFSDGLFLYFRLDSIHTCLVFAQQ